MKIIENFKIFFLDLLRNTDINLYKSYSSTTRTFLEGLEARTIALRGSTLGIDVTAHKIIGVRYELGHSPTRSFNVQVNITNLIYKIKQIKKGKNMPDLDQQYFPVIPTQPELQLPVTFVEKFGTAFELYRNNIMILCSACVFLESLYKDTKKAGYYCKVKIPAGQSNNELFEFRKEFLLPTKFINSDNFCEKLSETSSFNLQPIDVYENFVKFQSVCIKIFIPLGQICMRLIIVIPVVNVVNEAIFVGFLQIRTKTYFGIIATGIVSFFVSYGIVDNVYNMSIFVTSKTFNVISFTIKHIVRIIKSDKVEID